MDPAVKGLLVAYTNPVDSASENDFNRWYDETHLPEVVGGGEFTTAARFLATHHIGHHGLTPVASTSPGAYLAVYEVQSPDPVDQIARRVATTLAKNSRSAANDASTAHGVFYRRLR